jgi:hypothetical protein
MESCLLLWLVLITSLVIIALMVVVEVSGAAMMVIVMLMDVGRKIRLWRISLLLSSVILIERLLLLLLLLLRWDPLVLSRLVHLSPRSEGHKRIRARVEILRRKLCC